MNKLNPILTYPETYNFMSTPTAEFTSGSKKSIFVSSGRITDCIFTQFTGPDSNSKQITILATGDEALFGLLPDYSYKIRWKFQYFTPSKFWTINIDKNLAFRLYTVNGKLADLNCNRGCFEIFGFNFPIVLEMPKIGKIEIEVELGKHLITNNPLAPGDFCYENNYLYSNTGPSEELLRQVSDKLTNYNRELRNKYLSDFQGPCQTIVKRLITNNQVLTIDSNSTVANYSNTVSTWQCGGLLWLIMNSTSAIPLNIANTYGTFGNFISCYGISNANYSVQIAFNITLTYRENIGSYICGIEESSRFIGAYSLNSKGLLLSDTGDKVIAKPIFNGKEVKFTATYNTKIGKDNIYFGGYGLLYTRGGEIFDTPISITGTITITTL